MDAAEDNRLQKYTAEQIGKKLPNINSAIRKTKHRIDGKLVPYWDGIAWLGIDPKESPDPRQKDLDKDFANQPRARKEGIS